MTIQAEICDALMSADTQAGGKGAHLYALEAGTRICMIPAVRHARIDSAELVSFVRARMERDELRGYDKYATAIVDRFGLVELAR